LLSQLARAARGHAELVLRRSARLLTASRQTRVALTDGHGWGNLGDDAVHEAALRLLRDRTVESYFAASKERRLGRIGLSGPRYFSHYVLGGGTIINGQSVGLVRVALDQGIPTLALGSGAGGAGFNTPRSPDLSEWRALLPRFQALGVRGPRSLSLLRGLGASHGEVVGDLALALTPDHLPHVSENKRFAVNLMPGPPDDSEPAFHLARAAVRDVVQELMNEGWEPLFVSLCETDHPAFQTVMEAAGAPPHTLRLPRTSREFFDLVAPCRFIITTRLHAAVLASCVGTHPLALAYRDKVHDFMDSVELSDSSISLEQVDVIRERARDLARGGTLGKRELWQRARSFRSTLERFTLEQLGARRPL
jgi:polysaccharide pyruvyl transferase WcaK-like protein